MYNANADEKKTRAVEDPYDEGEDVVQQDSVSIAADCEKVELD